MSNNKTLADAQPGGRVRLATVLYDRAHDLLADAYNAGTHGIGYIQQAMELHDAIIPAQPSLGGQGGGVSISDDDRAVLQRLQDALPTVGINGWAKGVDVLERLLRESLAARQPVASNQVVEDFEQQAVDGARQPVAQEPALFANRWEMEHGTADGLVAMRAGKHMKNKGFFTVPLYAAPAQAVDLATVTIPDTPEVRDILGRPNFWCSPWANVLRMRGDSIPRKAEEEQAAVIRFMLNHYLANGADWAETAGAELDAIRKADSQAVGK